MKRKFTKTLASLLAILMLFACVPMNVGAADAFATVKEYMCAPSQYTNGSFGSGIEDTLTQNGSDVTVNFSAFDGSVIVPQTEMTVSDGLAESYGYNIAKKDHNGNRVDAVTVFDVLVAVHKEYYGDAFTPETATDYLVMNDSFILKAFGKSASSSGFVVNDVTPNDGIYNPAYGSYTGFACDTAELAENDDVTYFFYQDTEYWMDYKAVFANDEITAIAGEALTVNVSAFCIWYGYYDIDIIESMSVPADGVDIYSADGTKIATTDANGNATITFEDAGEYAIYVAGTVESEEAPIIIDWATVTVNEAQADEPIEPIEPPVELKWWQIVWNWIVNAFNTVWTFITNLFGC